MAFRDIGRLVDQVFGNRYQPQNNFTTIQKQKILDFLFVTAVKEGVSLQNNPPKKQFRETELPLAQTTREKLNVSKKKL